MQRHRRGVARDRYQYPSCRPLRASRPRSIQPQRVDLLASSRAISEAAGRRPIHRRAAAADGIASRPTGIHRLQVRHQGGRVRVQPRRGGLFAGSAVHGSDLPCCIAPTNSAEDWRNAILAVAGRFPRAGNELAEHAAFRSRRPSAIARQFLAVLSRVRDAGAQPVRFRALPTPAVLRNIERSFRDLRSRLLR